MQELCGKYLGHGTNNEAEYSAVVLAFETLLSKLANPQTTTLKFLLDSQLVANQLKGVYKIKEERLREFSLKIRELEKQFAQVSYNYIPRGQNKEADEIVNRELDHARAKRIS